MNKDWEAHWSELKEDSGFGKILKFYREHIIANAVAYYINKYFPKKGTCIECGSGSSQTTGKVKKAQRTLIAIDLSESALRKAKKVKQIDKTIKADIFKLPFKDSSIDGIWNLGVMEHFTLKEIEKALKEFSRVLKPGSYAILFWPPLKGHYHFSTNTIEFIANKIFRKNIDLFPDEINLFSKKLNIKERAKKSGFRSCKVEYSFRDWFTHTIVICRK